MNVPKLRFKGFVDRWETKEIGELAIISSGGTPSRTKPDFWNGSIPWITTSLIDFGTIDFAEEFITEEGLNSSSAKLFPKGTLLMAMYGQGKTRGKIAILGLEASTNQACAAIQFVNNNINVQFAYQNLAGRYDEIRDLSNAGGQENLSAGLIKQIQITYPAIPEQTKIANFLTAVDELIAQLNQKCELLAQYKKGIMQQIFSQQLRFKPALSEVEGDDDGKDFPDWENKVIGDVLTIGSGRDYKHLTPGNVPVYGTGGFMLSVNDYLYDGESVCIGRKGTIDKPVLLSGKFWTVDTLFYTHSFKSVLPKFIYAYFQMINWKNYNEVSGVPSLSKSTIEKIDITIPSIEEQIKIANFLTAIDDKISHTQAQLAAVKQYKQGLLQQMFV